MIVIPYTLLSMNYFYNKINTQSNYHRKWQTNTNSKLSTNIKRQTNQLVGRNNPDKKRYLLKQDKNWTIYNKPPNSRIEFRVFSKEEKTE